MQNMAVGTPKAHVLAKLTSHIGVAVGHMGNDSTMGFGNKKIHPKGIMTPPEVWVKSK